MDFFLIPASVSLILFIIALLRFPQPSFQYIILMLVAAALMFLAVSIAIIPIKSSTTNYGGYTENITSGSTVTQINVSASNSTTTQSPNPSANQLALYYDVSYLYIVVCILFSLMGVIINLTGRE